MRFTIRDLLWLTVVVALTVAWWLHHRAWVEKYSATIDESQLWQARTQLLEVRVDLLAERLRARPMPSPSAPAENLPSD